MALEGELKVSLRIAGSRVTAVEIKSTRPDIAQRLLQGRTRAEVLAAVPQVFSLCGRSQATACAMACAAAGGQLPSAQTLDTARLAVAAEMLREATWHTLLQWPRWLGEAPSPGAVAAARASTTFHSAAASAAAVQAIAQATYGMDAERWLALQTPPALAAWAQADGTGAARFIAHMATQDAAWPGVLPPVLSGVLPNPALLPAQGHAHWAAELAAAADADPGFAQQPSWRGQPAETGVLARRQHDTLIQALLQDGRSRMTARFVGRLQELALLLAGRTQPELGATALPDGSGLAWVENARGLLLHQAWLQGERVQRYRIVAPTEWNFNAHGTLVSALVGAAAQAPAADSTAVQRHAQCLIHSLDPCVACHVECSHA